MYDRAIIEGGIRREGDTWSVLDILDPCSSKILFHHPCFWFLSFTRDPSKTSPSDHPGQGELSWPTYTIPELSYKELSLSLAVGRAARARQCHLLNSYIPQLARVIGKEIICVQAYLQRINNILRYQGHTKTENVKRTPDRRLNRIMSYIRSDVHVKNRMKVISSTLSLYSNHINGPCMTTYIRIMP